MKKVGILTFHYADNYGAVLQALALKQAIDSIDSCSAEIINYFPKEYKIKPYEATKDGINKMIIKRRAYENFLIDKCKIKSSHIDSVLGEGLDYCCVGSDQVWNLNFRENETYEYLLPNVSDKVKKISYAASIGGPIHSEQKDTFKKYLKRFDNISVREESAADDIMNLGFEKPDTVVDPTLLMPSKFYEDLIEEPTKRLNDFLFFFSYPIGEELRKYAPFVNMLARKYKFKVLHSFINSPENLFVYDQGSMMYEGIGQFLWYMKNASVVVTTSYHGAIIGKIFERPTYIIARDGGIQRFNQLRNVLNIQANFVKNDWPIFDWDITNAVAHDENLCTWRDKSFNYLRRSLSEQ